MKSDLNLIGISSQIGRQNENIRGIDRTNWRLAKGIAKKQKQNEKIEEKIGKTDNNNENRLSQTNFG